MAGFQILLADDYEPVRRGLRDLLSEHDGWEIVAEAVDGRDAVAKTKQFIPDLVIMDIGMPHLNGLEATHEILARSPETKVLIVTVHANKHAANESKNLGAKGLLSKTDAVRDLVRAVETIQHGDSYFPMLDPKPAGSSFQDDFELLRAIGDMPG